MGHRPPNVKGNACQTGIQAEKMYNPWKMGRKSALDGNRISLIRSIHLFGSGCFFCFGAIYFLLLHSTYMLAANWIFGALGLLNWFALRSPGSDDLKGHLFLAIVYTGLLNVTVHVGAGLEPMIYWGLSVSVAAAFSFRIPGILFWVALCIVFFPLTYVLKVHVFPARVLPLDGAQTRILTAATYLGLLSFLAFVVYQFQQKLGRALGALQGRNRELEMLFRVVSHDLSGSVHLVRGHGDLQKVELAALQGRPLEAAALKRLEENNDRIRDGAERLQTILGSVREYALAASGSAGLKAEAVHLTEVLAPCRAALEAPMRVKSLAFDLAIPEGLPAVRFHPQTLADQVLMNLLTNAVKFSPPGGQIRLGARVEGNRVVLTIEDEGKGFPSEEVQDIDARVGFSTPGTLGEKGTGFGLAIAQAYLQRYGATLRIESRSTPGSHGVRAVVALPLA